MARTPHQDFGTKLLNQAKAFHASLDETRRKMFYVALAATVATVLGVGIWASHTPYQTIVSGRGHDELIGYLAKLEEAEITARLGSDGASLEVPNTQVGRARSLIESSGENLDCDTSSSIGISPAQIQANLLACKERQLAKTLNGYDAVHSSRVHLVPRHDSIFDSEIRPARSSVVLQLVTGAQLTSSDVAAMVNTVANAVDGLDPERVAISDTEGNSLTAGRGTEGLGLFENLDERRLALENEYRTRIERQLYKLTGSYAAFEVGVAVNLDSESKVINAREVNPDNVITVSERISESESTKSEASGVPGTANNDLAERAAGQDEAQSQSEMQSTSNQDYGTLVTQTVVEAGTLSSVSVGVTVSSAALDAALAAGMDEAAYVQKLEAVIAKTVPSGIESMVAIEVMPYAEVELVDAETAIVWADFAAFGPSAVALVAIALVFGTVVRPLMSKVNEFKTPEQLQQAEADAEAEAEAAAAAEEAALADKLRDLVDNFEHVDAEDLNRLVLGKADAAAEVLRQWSRTA